MKRPIPASGRDRLMYVYEGHRDATQTHGSRDCDDQHDALYAYERNVIPRGCPPHQRAGAVRWFERPADR